MSLVPEGLSKFFRDIGGGSHKSKSSSVTPSPIITPFNPTDAVTRPIDTIKPESTEPDPKTPQLAPSPDKPAA